MPDDIQSIIKSYWANAASESGGINMEFYFTPLSYIYCTPYSVLNINFLLNDEKFWSQA